MHGLQARIDVAEYCVLAKLKFSSRLFKKEDVRRWYQHNSHRVAVGRLIDPSDVMRDIALPATDTPASHNSDADDEARGAAPPAPDAGGGSGGASVERLSAQPTPTGAQNREVADTTGQLCSNNTVVAEAPGTGHAAAPQSSDASARASPSASAVLRAPGDAAANPAYVRSGHDPVLSLADMVDPGQGQPEGAQHSSPSFGRHGSGLGGAAAPAGGVSGYSGDLSGDEQLSHASGATDNSGGLALSLPRCARFAGDAARRPWWLPISGGRAPRAARRPRQR